MKVLGYVAALNDGQILDHCLQGILEQTYPVHEIVVVDNGSADGTPQRRFPPNVTLISHPENRGTSGAVVTGFEYALSRDYDWMWVFDADSVPRKDALEQLMRLYNSLSPEIQERIRVLGSLPVDAGTGTPHHGIVFTPGDFRKGFFELQPGRDLRFYECDSTMWSGSLFSLKAVREIGLPDPDYFLDWGDHEYGYRGTVAGFRTFMSQLSLIDHNLHPMPTTRRLQLGPISFWIGASPPIRRYYFCRNFVYFWFYEYQHQGFAGFLLPYFYLARIAILMGKIMLFNRDRSAELEACLKGLRDGLRRQLHNRY